MKATNAIFGVLLTLGMITGVLSTAPLTQAKKDLHRFTICHATGSEKNPYVAVTVDYHAFIKQGHDQHQDDRDIVPAVLKYNYAGKNLDKLDVLNNNCIVADDTNVNDETPPTADLPEAPSTPVKPDQQNKPEKSVHKYTLCHATRSASNPYRVITVDYNSIIKMGHSSHSEDAVSSEAEARAVKANGGHWGDVIPAIDAHNYAGLNWNKEGRALLDNDCKYVSDTDTETVTPVVTIDDETPEENIRVLDDAAFTDKPGFGALPMTGAAGVAPLMISLAGALTAGVSYLGAYLRRLV